MATILKSKMAAMKMLYESGSIQFLKWEGRINLYTKIQAFIRKCTLLTLRSHTAK